MIRLSRAGWNNVIIYAVMAFILLINVTQNSEEDTVPANATTTQLLAEHDVILTLTVNQMVSIERIGQTWRALPNVLLGQELDQMMSTWHTLEVEPIEKPENFDKATAVIASALLAGDSDLHYFMLNLTESGLIIAKQTPLGESAWYTASPQLYHQLLPQAVLSEPQVN